MGLSTDWRRPIWTCWMGTRLLQEGAPFESSELAGQAAGGATADGHG